MGCNPITIGNFLAPTIRWNSVKSPKFDLEFGAHDEKFKNHDYQQTFRKTHNTPVINFKKQTPICLITDGPFEFLSGI